MYHNIKKADDIYADIISIDNQYAVKQILSDKQNGQGKVFLVVKNNQWFAAKVFLRQADFKVQTIFLQKLKQYKEIMRIYYSNVSAKLLRQNNQKAVMPVIIMQYFERGDLCDFVYEAYTYNKKYNKSIYTIPFRVSKTLFYDILLGLQNIHKAGILHKDLKPQNVMMDFSFRARIIDFGLSGFIGQKYHGNIKIGTRQYRAPEAQNQDQEKQFLPSSDLFVAGIIFYYICFTGLPFLTTTDQNYKRFGIPNKIGLKKYWESLSDQKNLIIPEDIKQFFSQIFLLDPRQRPTIEQILNSKMMEDRANAEEVIKQMQTQYEKFTEKTKKLQRILQLKNKLKQAQQIQQINVGNEQINQQNSEDEQFRIIPPKESFFKELLSKYQVQPIIEKQKLQLSQNIYEKFSFQSSPSFILAWIQYFLQISKQNNSLRIINFFDNYKFIKFFTYLIQESSILCIQVKFQSPEEQVFVYSLKGKLLRRITDQKIIIEWQKQQDDLICHIFYKDLKQATQALFYYEIQQQKKL